MIYRLELEYKPTGELIRLTNASNISVSWKLNRAGALSFSLPLEDENLNDNIVQEGLNYIYFYQDDNLIWYGVLTEVNIDIAGNNQVDLVFKEIFELLEKKRNITSEYTNTDAGDIAWDLIDLSQNQPNGDLGITQGGIEPTKNRDRTYLNEPIGEKIIQLTEVREGFDFEITPSLSNPNSFLKFNVFKRKGTYRKDLQFNLDETNINNNVKAISYFRSLENLANRVTAEGEGEGLSLNEATVEDTELQAFYGLLEKRTQHKTVSRIDTLTDTAAEELRFFKQGLNRIELELNNINNSFGLYDVGDIIDVRVKYRWINQMFTVRIYGIDFNLGVNNEENIKLTVSTII